MYCQHFQQSVDQLGKIANSARGRLNRKNYIFPCLRSSLRIWSRETGSAAPPGVSPHILQTEADSGGFGGC